MPLLRLTGLSLTLLFGFVITADAAFDAAAATDAYLATVPADLRAKTTDYVNGGYALDFVDALYAVAVAWLLLGTGLSRRMRDLAERVGRWRWLHTLIYAVQYILVVFLLTLPFTFYRGYLREHDYGLSNHTLATWLTDTASSLLVTLVVMSLIITAAYAVIRRAPQTWWLWGAAVLAVFFAFGALVAPVFVEPLFNTYRPMEAGPLKDDIIALAHANGVPANDVLVVDASRQTKRISANVSGLLGTTRIALNDNLLNGASPVETRAVMAHEIGHYALGHIYEMIVYFGVLFLLALALTKAAFNRVLVRWGKIWGVRDHSDPAGFPALAAIVAVVAYLATPALSTIIRTQEAEADIFGLNAAREPDGFATVILKLATYRKLDPAPWEEAIFFDHPSARTRIRMAMDWKAAQSERDATASNKPLDQ